MQNFRRFCEAQFEFSPQMNVFIGKNASGKTSVLEAMTIIAGAYLSSFKQYVPSRFVQNISDQDVFLKEKKEKIILNSKDNNVILKLQQERDALVLDLQDLENKWIEFN